MHLMEPAALLTARHMKRRCQQCIIEEALVTNASGLRQVCEIYIVVHALELLEVRLGHVVQRHLPDREQREYAEYKEEVPEHLQVGRDAEAEMTDDLVVELVDVLLSIRLSRLRGHHLLYEQSVHAGASMLARRALWIIL